MLPAFLKQLQSSPGGCQSTSFRELLEEYLTLKLPRTRRACIIRLRDFAQFQKLPRTSWPSAVERLFQAPNEQAQSLYAAHRRWMELRRNAKTRFRKGSALYGLSHFLR